MTTAALEVRDLVVSYGGAPVVDGIDLTVRAGEVVALFGANGVGKTTTLSAIAGVTGIRGGTVELDGLPIGGQDVGVVARRGLALVPEDRCLFTQLTVAENLRIAARRHGGDTTLAFTHFPALEPLRRRRAGVLSGGEQQMLAVARALVMRPRVLLIDELSLGLAPLVVRHLLDAVRRLASDEGLAVLLVEQHVRLALSTIDRGYVLRSGRVVTHGTAAELERDDDALVRSYLGEGSS